MVLIAIGSIMAVVAVFDTKALSTAVTIMKPAIIRGAEVPMTSRVMRAIRLPSPQRCMESASTNPPK